jgi:hypothetical protein
MARHLIKTSLRRCQSGAVFVEFLIAFVAILTVFFCTAEFAIMSTASLLVRHSAMLAVRASAVIRLPNPNSEAPPGWGDLDAYQLEWVRFPPWPLYEKRDDRKDCLTTWRSNPGECARTAWNFTHDWEHREGEVTLAAVRGLYPWHRPDGSGLLGTPAVKCDPELGPAADDPWANETCKVAVLYHCVFPIAKQVLCGPLSSTRWLTAKASFPHQGARYIPEIGY